MPTVVVPNEYLLPEVKGQGVTKLRVIGRTVAVIFSELAERLPRFRRTFFRDDGSLKWGFTLLRRGEELEDVRFLPEDLEYGDEDVFHLHSNLSG